MKPFLYLAVTITLISGNLWGMPKGRPSAIETEKLDRQPTNGENSSPSRRQKMKSPFSEPTTALRNQITALKARVDDEEEIGLSQKEALSFLREKHTALLGLYFDIKKQFTLQHPPTEPYTAQQGKVFRGLAAEEHRLSKLDERIASLELTYFVSELKAAGLALKTFREETRQWRDTNKYVAALVEKARTLRLLPAVEEQLKAEWKWERQ